jgi:KDO2-lipid IV(A) lauroyltransferase
MIINKPSYFKYAPSWILFGLVWLLAQLPYKFIIYIGKGLGQLIKILIPSRKKVVLTNLKLCFKDLPTDDRNKLCNAHFSELGLMITQTIKAFLGNTTSLEQTAIIS